MDKNTLKMVLIMAAVVFGMTLLFKKPQARQDLTQTPVEEQPKEVVETVTPADLAGAADFIKLAGTRNEQGVVEYADGNVSLKVEKDSVSGVVAINDTLTVSYADVVAGKFPDNVLLNDKNAAVKAVKETLKKVKGYQAFSRFTHPQPDAKPVQLVAPDSTLIIEIDPHGAAISKAILPGYKSYLPKHEGQEIILFQDDANPNHGQHYGFKIRTEHDTEINTRHLWYDTRQLNDSTAELFVSPSAGSELGLRYTVHSGSYLVSMELFQRNLEGYVAGNITNAGFEWYQTMPRQERGRTFEERNSGVYYKILGDSPTDLGGMSSTTDNLGSNEVEWIAFKNQFFSSIFIPKKSFEGGVVGQKSLNANPDYLKYLWAESVLPYDRSGEVTTSVDIFFGPNLYPLLRQVDNELGRDGLYLTRVIPLGWSWLRWINTLIVIPVFNFLSGFISNYGIIILLLTLFIKLILFPFTYKSYMSQAKMRLLAPEIKEINEQYPGKENAMIRQQKTMALYSKAGASPLSGCLPMLLQMPILIAMFSFFPSCLELRGQSFLWAHDLAAPDVICTLPFTIPLYGDHVSLFCLLMTITNIAYTRINMRNQPAQSQMKGMKVMMYMMPVMFLFFFNDYAAALSYYYFLSLLITIIQTYIFRKCVNEKKLRQRMMENAAKPKKKSGFMARLEEAQRRQQAQLRQQQQQRNRRR